MSMPLKPRHDEEDDLDDLDDVLDQFSPQAQPTSPTPPPPSTSRKPVADGDQGLPEDLSAEFAKQMESLLKGLEIDPKAEFEGADGEREFAAAWEAMLVEGMDAMAPTADADPSSSSSTAPKDNDFQSRIRSTMNKLKESESGLKSSDASTNGDGDAFESLLTQLQGLGLSDLAGKGEESEEHLQGVLEAMMGQLMSKDVLYEPLKELNEKFPGYIAKNNSSISPEDKKRFEAQISCIKRLIVEFEAKSYLDGDEKAREKIIELMSELQTYGSPPEEIMGPLPPGFSMGVDGLPNMPDECKMN